MSELFHAGKNLTEIAIELGRSVSTISREKYRGACGVRHRPYSPFKGEQVARLRSSSRRSGKTKFLRNGKLRKLVDRLLKKHWSPEQIAATLSGRFGGQSNMTVSHETIYAYVFIYARGQLRKDLIACLRQKRPVRRAKANWRKGLINDLVSIEQRPVEVENREIPGHWEGDLVLGKNQKSAIGTLVERTSRAVILVPLAAKDPRTVAKTFAREVKHLPSQMKLSLTYDRGIEMTRHHRLFTARTKMRVYFCHPHSPWERGTCENTNMLVRDFFSKGTDFNTIPRSEIKKVQRLLNERPRKGLGWKTPKEIMENFFALNA